MSGPRARLALIAHQLARLLDFEKQEGRKWVANVPSLAPSSRPRPARAVSTGAGPATATATGTGEPSRPAPAERPVRPLLHIRAHRLDECGDGGLDRAPILIIGEAPQFEGENLGILAGMLHAIGFALDGEAVPVGPPAPGLARPRVILTLGHQATDYVVEKKQPFAVLMGSWHERKGLPVMPIYDPESIRGSRSNKKRAWQDLRGLLRRLELPLPEWSRRFDK